MGGGRLRWGGEGGPSGGIGSRQQRHLLLPLRPAVKAGGHGAHRRQAGWWSVAPELLQAASGEQPAVARTHSLMSMSHCTPGDGDMHSKRRTEAPV